MAALQSTSRGGLGPYAVAVNTLTAADTFAYVNGGLFQLVLTNPTGSAVPVLVKGNTATTVNVPGYGALDVSAGKTINVPANGSVAVNLDSISAFLTGSAVAVTGGTGVTAILFT